MPDARLALAATLALAAAGMGWRAARRRARRAACAPFLCVRGRPVRLLPRGGGSGKCAATSEALLGALARLRAAGVLGMDAEWPPGSRGEVTVLQLASDTEILLVHLRHRARLSACAMGALAELLSDTAVVKLGVGVLTDAARLSAVGLPAHGALDIVADLACALPLPPADLPRVGVTSSLAGLAERWCSVTLDKGLQCSDWGAVRLSAAQVAYAATDAAVSLEVAQRMHAHALRAAAAASASGANGKTHAAATSAAAADDDGGGGGGECGGRSPEQPSLAAVCRRLVGLLESGPTPSHRSGAATVHAAAPKPGAAAEAAGSADKPRAAASAGADAGGARRTAAAAHKLPARKTALYENCLILSKAGEPLAVCSKKKLRWYLERGLAEPADVPSPSESGEAVAGAARVGSEVASALAQAHAQQRQSQQRRQQQQPTPSPAAARASSPMAIRLLFEEAGRGHADDEYYMAPKQNVCAACGADGEHARHAVVPHAYRTHFPAQMKSHLSHDVLLLCRPCHVRAEAANAERARALAARLAVPLEHQSEEPKFILDPALDAVQRAARALLHAEAGGAGDGGRRRDRRAQQAARRRAADGGAAAAPPAAPPPAGAPAAARRMPEERARAHRAVLAAHFGLAGGADAVTAEHVQRAASLEARRANPAWVPHGRRVVGALGGDAQIAGFVRGWRQHFLDSLRPSHLPVGWSVDARVANSTAPCFGVGERADERGRARGGAKLASRQQGDWSDN